MQYISYLLFRLFRLLMKIVPFWLLYLLSDFMFVLFYYVIRYRRAVVLGNLTRSFPDKSQQEIKKIMRAFYSHFGDILVESIKGYGMTQKQIDKRYRILNPEIVDDLYEANRGLIACAYHYGNWEWGIMAVASKFKHQAISLYMPVANKHIERYLKKLRADNGMEMVSIRETKEAFMVERKRPPMIIMAADQNPSPLKNAIWMKFLNQITACIHGPEAYSKKMDFPLIFFDVKKVKRGYYTLEVKRLIDNPRQTELGEITKAYMSTVEKLINQKPDFWLWSHKRWKYTLEQYNEHGRALFPDLDK